MTGCEARIACRAYTCKSHGKAGRSYARAAQARARESVCAHTHAYTRARTHTRTHRSVAGELRPPGACPPVHGRLTPSESSESRSESRASRRSSFRAPDPAGHLAGAGQARATRYSSNPTRTSYLRLTSSFIRGRGKEPGWGVGDGDGGALRGT